MPTSIRSLAMMCAMCVASCATGPTSVQVSAQAEGSTYFRLAPPAVYKAGSGLELAGRVCRRAHTTLLSPREVRIEHLSASGALLDVTLARVAPIHPGADQSCANYASRTVDWKLAEDDLIRACFARNHACPVSAPKTLIQVPVVPAPPP